MLKVERKRDEDREEKRKEGCAKEQRKKRGKENESRLLCVCVRFKGQLEGKQRTKTNLA